MINIIGTYECKADAKGRVMFPNALKKQLQILQKWQNLQESLEVKELDYVEQKEWKTLSQEEKQKFWENEKNKLEAEKLKLAEAMELVKED